MTRLQEVCQRLKTQNIKRWLKESLQPISTSIEDMQREAAERKQNPSPNPEDVMFDQMKARLDKQRDAAVRRQRQESIARIAQDILVKRGGTPDSMNTKIAIQQATAIHDLIEQQLDQQPKE